MSNHGYFRLSRYVTRTDRIVVARFTVPTSLEGTHPFVVTALGAGRYSLRHELLEAPLEGVVNQPLRAVLPDGVINFQLSVLDGKPGAELNVSVASRDCAIERLQDRLVLAEQGRQSNVINVWKTAVADSRRACSMPSASGSVLRSCDRALSQPDWHGGFR